MSKQRIFKSPKEMEEKWEEYKNYCDNQVVLTHEFSQKFGEFVSQDLRKKITYTIEGFCVWAKIARSKFYETYDKDEKYRDIVQRMREECEIDARAKFETGQIPTQLAGLWMSKHGYTNKTEAEMKADIKSDTQTEMVIKFEGELETWSQ